MYWFHRLFGFITVNLVCRKLVNIFIVNLAWDLHLPGAEN